MIIIYTDGSCLGNGKDNAPGGWAAILLDSVTQKKCELSGCEKNTTNNKMELTAILKGLQRLTKSHDNILIYTDSEYCINVITGKWKKVTKNLELIQTIKNEVSKHKSVKFEWTKGHSTDEYNNKCDELAVQESTKLSIELSK